MEPSNFVEVLSERNRDADVTIAEAQTLLYVSRQLDFTRARILAIKNHVPLAAIPTQRTAEVLGVITKVFHQFVAARSVLETSMDNIGAVFHPAITVFNAGRIETHSNFDFYVEGVTPSLGKALEAVDAERVAVAYALGVHSHTAREWLRSAYNSIGENLYEAMQATAGYRGVKGPESLMHRYLLEDIPTGLVPISSLGDLLNVPTPSMNALTDLACALHGIDYRKEGRNMERLGLSRMNVQQIRSLVE